MKVTCIDKERNTKLCPYRVFTRELKALTIGSGDCTTQEFYPCALDSCVAFHEGICLRLQTVLKEVE